MQSVDLASIFAIALVGSFGHCIGMCGGIVLAYTGSKVRGSFVAQIAQHLLYSAGRVSTYTLLGLVFGLAGSAFSFSNYAYALLLFVAGVFMVLAGLSLAGKVSFLDRFERRFTTSRYYIDAFRGAISRGGSFSLYKLGLLNGLLPCGFVYFFAITAASSASAYGGALVMFTFGLATVPALLIFGLFAGALQGGRFRKAMMQASALAIIVYGIFTIYNGTTYITNPNKTLLECHGEIDE